MFLLRLASANIAAVLQQGASDGCREKKTKRRKHRERPWVKLLLAWVLALAARMVVSPKQNSRKLIRSNCKQHSQATYSYSFFLSFVKFVYWTVVLQRFLPQIHMEYSFLYLKNNFAQHMHLVKREPEAFLLRLVSANVAAVLQQGARSDCFRQKTKDEKEKTQGATAS